VSKLKRLWQTRFYLVTYKKVAQPLVDICDDGLVVKRVEEACEE
jgi:hypothetical protein